jgi:hypothetical protein
MKTVKRKQSMVDQMREIREQISCDIMNMSLAEERAYLNKQLKKLKEKRDKAKK